MDIKMRKKQAPRINWKHPYELVQGRKAIYGEQSNPISLNRFCKSNTTKQKKRNVSIKLHVWKKSVFMW